MEENKKRIELFLITSFLCCCVMMIHISSEGVSGLQLGSWQQLLFYVYNKAMSFVVPAFIFLSGLKLTYSYGEKPFVFSSFFKKRFLKILVPYLCWYVAYYIFLRFLDFIEPKTWKEHFYSIVLGDLISPFYFITIIFQFYLLYGIFLYTLRKVKPMILLVFTIVIEYLYLQYTYLPYEDRFFLTYLIYFMIGCIAARNIHLFEKILQKYQILIYICFFFFLYWHISHAYESMVYGTPYGYWRLYTVGFSLSAILVCYHFALFCVPKLSNTMLKWIQVIDAGSFYIFLGHCFLLYFCNDIWFNIGIVSIFKKFLLNTVCIIPTSILLASIYVTQKKKWRQK